MLPLLLGFLAALLRPGAAGKAAASLVTEGCLHVPCLALLLHCLVRGEILTLEKVSGKWHADSIQNF